MVVISAYVWRNLLKLVQRGKRLVRAEALAEADALRRHTIQSLHPKQGKISQTIVRRRGGKRREIYTACVKRRLPKPLLAKSRLERGKEGLTLKLVDSSSSDVPEFPCGNSNRFIVA